MDGKNEGERRVPYNVQLISAWPESLDTRRVDTRVAAGSYGNWIPTRPWLFACENYRELNYPKWPVTREKAITRRVESASICRYCHQFACTGSHVNSRTLCAKAEPRRSENRYRSCIVAAAASTSNRFVSSTRCDPVGCASPFRRVSTIGFNGGSPNRKLLMLRERSPITSKLSNTRFHQSLPCSLLPHKKSSDCPLKKFKFRWRLRLRGVHDLFWITEDPSS